jgi:hypothetical protein
MALEHTGGAVRAAAHAAAAWLWRTRIGAVILVGLLAGSPVLAGELIWVTVEATAPVTSSDTKQARLQAIASAERQAVAEALAKGISIETLLVNLRLSGSIVGTIPFGKVVEKKILEEQLVKAGQDDAKNQKQLFRVRIKAGVARESGSGEPSFHLETGINRSVFKDGDELEIKMRSTKDCYFAIFNILEDQKVIRLLPNYLSQKNFLSANENFSFPGSKDRKKGLKLVVHLPEKKAATTESIYILALPRPFELKSIKVQEGIFGVFNGQTAFMNDLIREVVSIPLESRAEALMQYEIRKSKKGN